MIDNFALLKHCLTRKDCDPAPRPVVNAASAKKRITTDDLYAVIGVAEDVTTVNGAQRLSVDANSDVAATMYPTLANSWIRFPA